MSNDGIPEWVSKVEVRTGAASLRACVFNLTILAGALAGLIGGEHYPRVENLTTFVLWFLVIVTIVGIMANGPIQAESRTWYEVASTALIAALLAELAMQGRFVLAAMLMFVVLLSFGYVKTVRASASTSGLHVTEKPGLEEHG